MDGSAGDLDQRARLAAIELPVQLNPNLGRHIMAMEVDLATGGAIQFDDANAARNWLDGERKSWAWIPASSYAHAEPQIPSLRSRFNQGWGLLDTAIKTGNQQDIQEAFAQVYRGKGKILHSATPEGRFLCRIAEKHVNLANAVGALLLEMWKPQSQNWQYDALPSAASAAWAAFKEGATGLERDLSRIRISGMELVDALGSKKEEHAGVLIELQKNGEMLLSGAQEKFTTAEGAFRETFDRFIGEVRKEYDNLKKFYETELALRAPVEYWAAVAKKHRVWAAVWGGLFALALSAALTGLFLWGDEIRQFLGSSQPNAGNLSQSSAATLFLVLGFSTLLFWGLRMIARIFLSNYHGARDAAERETMAKTFLALRREGNVTDEQLSLVLAPLFKPSATGLIRDDSAPDYGLHSLLSKLLSKDKV